MQITWLLLPLLGAVIGYLTNYLAIKMLFHPRYPIIIFGVKIQGIFPRRQVDFAKKLGYLVASELLSIDEITERLQQRAASPEFIALLEQHIQQVLLRKLPDYSLLLSISDKLLNNLTAYFRDDIEDLLQQLIIKLREDMKQDINIEQIVSEKVAAFNIEKLEKIVFDVMAKEFRFVEWIGAVLGFLIGLVQVVIVMG
ncbi:DUF445 domain-containing protein [Thioflexithrix psekupsensis]|uniref:DUF445 domain-containing protein n=1 Tax=Thioflexithrix psekupsensis TaxID=1570016 RepID=A0A251XC37_9GAMM|nr:DUF445 family protein [Thioflexithrix psekupsensis]OUD16296.1 hypothetical protein TPSD3_00820 [Thioflexithrix psekupsensis]